MSWKTTNNRNKTTATDVIRCDELITDDIIAENASLNKKITVDRNITLRDLSITDISITTIIAVPDVSVNRIGENIVGGMIEFISPFSAPAAEITSIFANDSSISQLSTHDLSVDIIKSTGNNIHFHNADVSFIGNVKTHDACFNELFTLDAHEFNFLSDISTNDAIYVSDISVDIVRGPIKIEFEDISLHNVQHASDVSLANNLDVSLLELMNMGSISGARLTIHPDVSFHDISALGLSVDVITMVSVTGDVSVNGDLSINGEIKAGGLKAHGEIVVTEDASFEHLHGNDISVNNIYGTYLLSDTSLVIHGDISINNTNELRIPMDPRDINQLKKKPLSVKKELAKDTFGIITENAVYNSLIFRNNIGNFSTVKMDDLNVKRLTISQLTLTDGSFNNGYFATTDVSSHTLSGDLSGFSGGFVIGDHGYLVPDNSSVMVRFGLSNEDNVATDISLIDFDDLSGSSGGFSKGNYGYLVPDTSTTLVRYNASNDDVSKIVLNDDLSGFRGGFASDGSGYLVPHLGHKVVSFPLTDNSFTTDYVEDISLTDYFLNTDLSGFYGGFSSNNNIFLAPNSHSKLVKIKEDEFVKKNLSVNVLNLANTNADGFTDGFAVGEYGYLVPNQSPAVVARFDLATFSQVDFLNLNETDPNLHGFRGGFAADGSGYLVPHSTSTTTTGSNGHLVSFDLATFSQVSVLNLTDTHNELKGFWGGFAAGDYGYLVPYYHGKMARFKLDTFSPVDFLNLTTTNTVGQGIPHSGFRGGFAAGDYGYLVPYNHGKMARFKLDTLLDVDVLNLTDTHPDLKGFWGGFSAHGFGYLVPHNNDKAVRFDLETFSQVSVLDVPEVTGDSTLKGFAGGFTAGDYGYLVPYSNGTSCLGKAVRFDLATFSQVSVLDVPEVTGDSTLKGFSGGFTAGDYGYMAPHDNGTSFHGNVVRFPITTDFSSIDLSLAKSDPDLTGFKGGFVHDNSGYLIPGENGKVVEFSTFDFSANNVNVIDLSYLTGDASLVKFSGGFKDETHGYLIPETFNKVARFDLSTALMITSLDISVNGKDVSGFSGGFISGDYGYLIPNKSNELVRFSTNQTKQMNDIIINSDDKFTLNTFKSNDTITIDKNRAYNLRIDFSYLMAIDLDDDIPYEDVSMMVEIKPSSDISYFYNYDNSGSAGPGASEDISNVVRITDLSYSEAFNFTFARKSDTDLSMMITLRDNCNNDTAGNAVYKVIDFDVNKNNAAEDGNFDATYELALRDRNDLSFINIYGNISYSLFKFDVFTLNENRIVYSYLNSNGIKLFDKVLIETLLSLPLQMLYFFESHMFTSAGKFGNTGPAINELRTAYNSAAWAQEHVVGGPFLTEDGGIQVWTVPVTGTYRITASGSGSRATNQGGYGANITGNTNLIKGEVILILVGQVCADQTSGSHGGGGGTFVVRSPHNDSDDSIIVIAGGGGGGHDGDYSATPSHLVIANNVGNASLTTSGKRGYGGGVGGTNGGGGGVHSDGGWGGAGYRGAGSGYWDGVAAQAFIDGGTGGVDSYGHAMFGYTYAGFGGGGAHGHSHGGGGGGYSGGGGSTDSPFVGGGGGSYKGSSFTLISETVNHDGNGQVTITRI